MASFTPQQHEIIRKIEARASLLAWDPSQRDRMIGMYGTDVPKERRSYSPQVDRWTKKFDPHAEHDVLIHVSVYDTQDEEARVDKPRMAEPCSACAARAPYQDPAGRTRCSACHLKYPPSLLDYQPPEVNR